MVNKIPRKTRQKVKRYLDYMIDYKNTYKLEAE